MAKSDNDRYRAARAKVRAPAVKEIEAASHEQGWGEATSALTNLLGYEPRER